MAEIKNDDNLLLASNLLKEAQAIEIADTREPPLGVPLVLVPREDVESRCVFQHLESLKAGGEAPLELTSHPSVVVGKLRKCRQYQEGGDTVADMMSTNTIATGSGRAARVQFDPGCLSCGEEKSVRIKLVQDDQLFMKVLHSIYYPGMTLTLILPPNATFKPIPIP